MQHNLGKREEGSVRTAAYTHFRGMLIPQNQFSGAALALVAGKTSA